MSEQSELDRLATLIAPTVKNHFPVGYHPKYGTAIDMAVALIAYLLESQRQWIRAYHARSMERDNPIDRQIEFDARQATRLADPTQHDCNWVNERAKRCDELRVLAEQTTALRGIEIQKLQKRLHGRRVMHGKLRQRISELNSRLSHLTANAGNDSCADYVARNRALTASLRSIIEHDERYGDQYYRAVGLDPARITIAKAALAAEDRQREGKS